MFFLSFLKFAAIPRISAYGFPRMDFRGWSFLLFSGLRFPHEVRPRQLLCWRRPRWFSTSSDLCFLSLFFTFDFLNLKLTTFDTWPTIGQQLACSLQLHCLYSYVEPRLQVAEPAAEESPEPVPVSQSWLRLKDNESASPPPVCKD